jgi:hypothetical protein
LPEGNLLLPPFEKGEGHPPILFAGAFFEVSPFEKGGKGDFETLTFPGYEGISQ